MQNDDSREATGSGQTASAEDFAVWYGALWPRVLRAVTVSVGDRDLAEEATAEAFAKALVRWPAPTKLDSPIAWLHKVAVNEIRSRWRRGKLERRVIDRLGAEVPRGRQLRRSGGSTTNR